MEGMAISQSGPGAFECLHDCCPLLGPVGFLWQLLSKRLHQAGQGLEQTGHIAGSPGGHLLPLQWELLYGQTYRLALSSQNVCPTQFSESLDYFPSHSLPRSSLATSALC